MRIITGTIRATPTQWLPVLSHIVPPHIRRQSAALKTLNKFNFDPDSFPVISYIPENRIPRLKSRKPLWSNSFLNSNFSNDEIWKSEWRAGSISNKQLISDPSIEVPGFNLLRRTWSILNRIRTGHGRCNRMLFKWNSVESPNCECGEVEETFDHLINSCRIYKFQDTHGVRFVPEVDY